MTDPSEKYALWLGKLGGRKFALTVFVQLINAILVWHGSISSETYGIVCAATTGAYIAGNVVGAIKGG